MFGDQPYAALFVHYDYRELKVFTRDSLFAKIISCLEKKMKVRAMKVTKELFLADFPAFAPVTAETKKKNAKRHITGSVRLAQGRYRTDEEERARRERVRAIPLP